MGFLAQNGQKCPFLAKMPFLGILGPFSDPARRGFTSTPRAGAPRYRKRGFCGVWPGGPEKGLFWPFLGPLGPGGDFSPREGPWASPKTPGGYRGAPPRGVDVKPPLGTGSRDPPGGPGTPPGPRGPGTGAPGPSGTPSQAPEGASRGSPGGGFTSTPRAGAPRFPGDPRPGVPGSTPPREEGPGEEPPPLICRGGGARRRGRARVSPQGCSV